MVLPVMFPEVNIPLPDKLPVEIKLPLIFTLPLTIVAPVINREEPVAVKLFAVMFPAVILLPVSGPVIIADPVVIVVIAPPGMKKFPAFKILVVTVPTVALEALIVPA